MQFVLNNNISLVLCESGKEFGKRIYNNLAPYCRGAHLNFKVVDSQEVWFKNKEVKTVIKEPIRGDDVYIIQLLTEPESERSINDNFIALLTAIDAVHQADAGRITVIIPQYPYGRQERRKEREGITAKLAARFMEEVGAYRVITIDIHSEAIGGFFDVAKLENLHASKPLMQELDLLYGTGDYVVVAPDTGGTDRARYYAKRKMRDFAIIYKSRDYSKISTIDVMKLIGEVKGRNVFVVDDMIDTGGTMIKACELLKENKAKKVVVACTFAFFNGEAEELIRKAYEDGIIDVIVGTDAVMHGPEFMERNKWYREVSVANLFAQVIYNINQNKSISAIL
ncbi:MAG: hypothetical protein CVV50_04990, partial [Spirochaetae bacterium HGW-Spirochaetae-6]